RFRFAAGGTQLRTLPPPAMSLRFRRTPCEPSQTNPPLDQRVSFSFPVSNPFSFLPIDSLTLTPLTGTCPRSERHLRKRQGRRLFHSAHVAEASRRRHKSVQNCTDLRLPQLLI